MKNPRGKRPFPALPGGKSFALSAQTEVLPEIFKSFCGKEKNLPSQIDF